MSTLIRSKTISPYRVEMRQYKRVFVEVSLLDAYDEKSVEALTTDFSDSGISLITDMPLPIGTRIKISFNDQVSAIGEVINIDNWDHYGISRLGVRFLQQNDGWMLH